MVWYNCRISILFVSTLSLQISPMRSLFANFEISTISLLIHFFVAADYIFSRSISSCWKKRKDFVFLSLIGFNYITLIRMKKRNNSKRRFQKILFLNQLSLFVFTCILVFIYGKNAKEFLEKSLIEILSNFLLGAFSKPSNSVKKNQV